MPKMKSNRAAMKRFRKTANGKIKRRQSHLRHILTKKSRKRKRGLRKGTYIAAADVARVKRLISS